MAAVHSCYRTMEAMATRDFPDQKFIDRSFRSAALLAFWPPTVAASPVDSLP